MKRAIPLIAESPSDLLGLLHQISDKRGYERLRCLYLLQSGHHQSRQSVAEALGRHRRTIGSWLRSYEEGGLSSLLHIKTHSNHSPSLNPEEVSQLEQRLQSPEGFLSYGAIQDWIEKTFDKSLPYSTVHHWSRYRLRAKLKVPRKSHVNKDEELSTRIKKNLPT